jgi:hypothetical protein
MAVIELRVLVLVLVLVVVVVEVEILYSIGLVVVVRSLLRVV